MIIIINFHGIYLLITDTHNFLSLHFQNIIHISIFSWVCLNGNEQHVTQKLVHLLYIGNWVIKDSARRSVMSCYQNFTLDYYFSSCWVTFYVWARARSWKGVTKDDNIRFSVYMSVITLEIVEGDIYVCRHSSGKVSYFGYIYLQKSSHGYMYIFMKISSCGNRRYLFW